MQPSSAVVVGVSLRELLPDACFLGADDIRVTSCCRDSRACRPGDLFVALPGAYADGEDFVVHAMARGAAAVLTSRAVEGVSLPMCVVPRVAAAYARLCHALAGNPTERLKTVGVAGVDATTVSYLTAAVLEAGGLACGVIGSLGYFDGLEIGRESFALPDAAKLAQLLARVEANGCRHVALEATHDAVCQDRLAGVCLDVAAIGEIRSDHLDDYRTALAYRGSKANVLSLLKPEGVAVFNVDQPAVAELAKNHDGPALTIGLERPAEIQAIAAEQWISEQTFLLSIGDVTVPVRTPLIGKHNIYNCLLAAAIGEIYGIDVQDSVRGLESITCIPGRLERIECGQPFSVFVDRAGTPDRLAQALMALRPLTRGHLICVFGASVDGRRFAQSQMGRVADRHCDLLVVTSDAPGEEDASEMIEQVLSGVRRRERVTVEPDRTQAIARALERAGEGDCVLIAGEGAETHQEFNDKRHCRDDRQTARDWLFANVRPRSIRKAA
jgi:UDP-N-acetylmuramoyl-L-alanyl-D-glutamate--2,6-diaminopimelate ligase